MTKIYLPNAWGTTNVVNVFKHQTPNNDGVWNDIVAVNSKEEADYIIVQDNTSESVDFSKVIFFGREPSYVQGINQKWIKNQCHKFLHHDKDTTWMPQTWWVGTGFGDLSSDNQPTKTKNLSIIDSGKGMTDGHKKRSVVIQNLIRSHVNDFDLYGKIANGKSGKPYVSQLPHRKKEGGLLDYRYNLAIENGSTNSYFSEKIVDPLLCWTMPIYWGCKDIDKFLPKGSYIEIDVTKSGVAKEIIDISKSNLREENIDVISEARDLIMNKYNLWPTIERAINNDKMF